ncbi:hypothetical protein AI2615V1_0755 [Enterobacter cloacae]|nr:hypothetical protein AI2615V1_0755 [Enterobacter cloacae]CAH3439299.1 hypothetical protein AI2615V1_0755 [Enterobacter cloacae]
MFWHLRRCVAFVVSVGGVFSIGIGIRTYNVNACRERRLRFQLYATGADLTAFNGEE